MRNRGFALLLVLWAMAILALLLGAYGLQARSAALAAETTLVRTQAHAAAEAGAMIAVAALAMPNVATRWVADGRRYVVTFGGFVLHIRCTDASGLVDLNSASRDTLRGLFQAAGAPPANADVLAQAIIRWRRVPIEIGMLAPSGDSEGHGPFVTLGGLRGIPGISGALFRRVDPALTLWSGRPAPDPRFAPALVRSAVNSGSDQAMISQLSPLPSSIQGASAFNGNWGSGSGVVRIDIVAIRASRRVDRFETTVRLIPGDSTAVRYWALDWGHD